MRKTKTDKESAAFLRLIIILLLLLAASCIILALQYVPGSRKPDISGESKTHISCSWWGNDPRHIYTLDGIDRFEKQNPEIKVTPSYGVWDGFEYHNEVVMRSHTEADVMQINYAWLSTFSPDGSGYYDLRKLDDVIDLSQFSEKDLAYGTMSGKLNALPIAYNMPAFFYNQDILDRYHLTVPESWDDLFEDARVLSEDGIYLLGGSKKHIWLMLLAWYRQTEGSDSFSADGTCLIDEKGFGKILDFYKSLLDEKVIMPINEFGQQFQSGTQAGILCWISDADRFCQPLDEKGISVTLGPSLSLEKDDLTGWLLKPATMLAVSSITDHPQEAGKLLNYFLNDPDFALLQGTEKGLPVSQSARSAVEESGEADVHEMAATEMMTAHLDEIRTIIPQMENDDIISAFKEEADRYLYGKAGKEECTAAIVRKIAEITAQ